MCAVHVSTKPCKSSCCTQTGGLRISGVTRSAAAPVQEEPHASRKTAILAKYPKIKELMRPEPLTKWVVFGTVALQVGRPLLVSHVAAVAVRHFDIGGAVACAVLL